ncbi:MAG: type III-B CRISPR-associated protein Cas10/Cmr2 [Gammaproteobacteria bacterium]|nr:MAG: type III-B CRISPR-associated protein Cas10/Cmr2 [Gammaproteobacteria bacterium]
MKTKHYFHFTIGPVQGFVAQARRTRDFWAGSFLLSWLSGVAMQASIDQGATIMFPAKNDHYLDWLTGRKKGGSGQPRQGSIPNRFKAQIDSDFKTEQVTKSVQTAWKALADQVYKNDIEDALIKGGISSDETKKIWERQIENFWEISWAIAESKADSSILDERKNWRSHMPPPEPGVKCMMMDGWQELSATPTPHSKGLSSFWDAVRGNGQKGMLSDLYDGESLCAMSFIKRRFVRYFNELKDIKMPGGWALHGWKLAPGIPSVSYLAAVHWLEEVMRKAQNGSNVEGLLSKFNKQAYELTRERGEWDTEIKCIQDLVKSQKAKEWSSHDGNVFFPAVLENKRLYPDLDKARAVVNVLKQLSKAVELPEATPFYAVLMMDGDRLGKHMGDVDKQESISTALDKFTRAVPGIVYDHNGFLIYAGGDDVLAILPMEDALKCALQIKNKYDACFRETNVPTSLSGAVEYAHINMPLTSVLFDAHDLLDTIAKERTGRNALAVRVWKPGGTALQWAQPWEVVVDTANKRTIALENLVDVFRHADEDDPCFSSKFFYKIRERFDLLNPEQPDLDPILQFDQRVDLMAMAYINSGKTRETGGKQKTVDEVKKKITPLITQCTPHYRDGDGTLHAGNCLAADGALLVRFLSQKGVAR